VLASAACAAVAAGQPADDRAAFIEPARQQALAYNDNLPNFICTQETRRSAASDKAGTENWKLLDTLSIRLSYFGKQEDYRVVQVNGKPADMTMKKLGGWKTLGDFGTMMADVFREKSKARFTWDRRDTWNGHAVVVLKFHIDRENSTFHSTAMGFLHAVRSYWAVDGDVYVDADTHQVLRLAVRSVDVPAKDVVREFRIAMEYAMQKIGDREYLLPAKSDSVIATRNERRQSETLFTDYRKFTADTAITFGEAR
jgi:hypothetical protein